jgi:hypothetical protein
MSQITIVENVLNFTEVSAPSRDQSPDRIETEGARRHLDKEEQRTVHELTSILISGHLPQ